MAKSSTNADRRPLQRLQTVADLIETPALARIYVYAEREGSVIVGEIVDELAIPQGTAYDYVQRLETAGLLRRINETRPYEYDAESISLTLSVDGATTTVTPALVAAIARRDEDKDVDVYIERHGLDGLAETFEYAAEYADGTVNHRIVARDLDLSPLEAEIILQALEPVLIEYATTE